ncbi:MAG: Hsp20 family protein [Spirochaetaceae bacterium]|jgi:HSP20 family molecular chaperone IbpA|nr:Hsp20 family protein [Spirochaetaceae bacterium]
MKGSKGYVDLGTIFDEIFEAAQNFSDEFHRNFNEFDPGIHSGAYGPGSPFGPKGPFSRRNPFDENIDYYPNYSYPPMNVYMTADRSMNFEFALAGFDEKDISLSFQGDYMVFSAKIGEDWSPERGSGTVREAGPGGSAGDDTGEDCSCAADGHAGEGGAEENVRYFKRRLKMKDIEKQKYYVPLDKYAQEKVKAVYKNGILKVSIPPKDEPDQNDGIRIEIIKEGN